MEKNVDYKAVPTNEKNEKQEETPLPRFGTRHFQLIIMFVILTVSLVIRSHIGVTVVAMTSHGANKTDPLNINSTQNNTAQNDTREDDVELRQMRYDWPKPIQEMVLNSFFLGYCIMMMPMAVVCQKFGGKVPLQLSLFVNSVASFLSPWMTQLGGWKAVCLFRVISGMAQAGTYPSLQTLLAEWVPLSERATMSSCVFTGSQLGTVIGYQLAGILCASSWGWPSMFYAVGVICALCLVFLTLFTSKSPLEHKSLSEAERNFIRGNRSTPKQSKGKIPWKAILTSKPVWATLATQIGGGASFVFIFTQVPSYIHYICGADIKYSGLLSSLPYVISFCTSMSYGVLSDFLTNRGILSRGNARKIFNSLSHSGAALGLIATSFSTSPLSAVPCLILTLGLFPALHVGWMVNQIDISPNYGGTLMALGNTLGNVVTLIIPVMVSFIVVDVTNVFQWRIMMFTIAGMLLFTNVVFVALMSAKVQPWNELEQEADEEENTKENEKNQTKGDNLK